MDVGVEVALVFLQFFFDLAAADEEAADAAEEEFEFFAHGHGAPHGGEELLGVGVDEFEGELVALGVVDSGEHFAAGGDAILVGHVFLESGEEAVNEGQACVWLSRVVRVGLSLDEGLVALGVEFDADDVGVFLIKNGEQWCGEVEDVAGADEGNHSGCRRGDSGVGLIRLTKHVGVLVVVSPEVGDETVVDFVGVVGVAGEVSGEVVFFVEESGDDDGDEDEAGDVGGPGGEGEGDAEEHKGGAGVHGVADDGVGAGGDDVLVGLDFDDAGGKGVFAEDAVDDREAEDDEEVAGDAEGPGEGGPVEVVVEAGGEEEGEEADAGDGLYELLSSLFFCGGSGSEACFDESGLCLRKCSEMRVTGMANERKKPQPCQ